MALPDNLLICRTCVLKAPSLANIFGDRGALGFSIAELINELLELDVSPGDGLPDKICCNCLNELARFKRFKNICHEAKVTLEYIVNKDKTGVLPQVLKDANTEDKNALENSTVEIVDVGDSSEDEDSGAETVCAPSPPPIFISSDEESPKEVSEGSEDTLLCEPSTSSAAALKYPSTSAQRATTVASNVASLSSRNITALASTAGGAIGNSSEESEDGLQLPESSSTQFKESETQSKRNELFECPFCFMCISTSNKFQEHLKKCDREPVEYICDVCDKSFIDDVSLKSHFLSHSNDSCPGGEGDARDGQRVEFRKKVKSPDVGKSKKEVIRLYKCGACHIAFKGVSALRTHLQSHPMDSKCACGECKKQFKSLNKLCGHIIVRHNRGFFKCHTCSTRFLDRYSLKRHSNEHCRGLRPFVCIICQNSFKTQNSLDVHISESH